MGSSLDNNSDKEFITSVVKEHSDMIIRIAFNYTRNMFDAEDIAQDVFLSLLTAPLMNGEAHLKAWLIRVTINKTKDFLKSAQKKRNVPLDEAKYQIAPNADDVLNEIDCLNPQDRILVYLFYFERYTAKEIGEILSLKERAVLVRLHRARAKLKTLLELSYQEICPKGECL